MRKIKIFCILALTVFAVGCAEVSEKVALYQNVTAPLDQYDFKEVDVEFKNAEQINITITDSPLLGYDSGEQQKIIREVSEVISELKSEGYNFKRGVIKFVDETKLGIYESSVATAFDLDLK